PLVVPANRDEFHERPTEGPALREASISTRRARSGRAASARSIPVVAPRDLRAGGSWLGVSGSGLFAAITNRHCDGPDPARRARGGVPHPRRGVAARVDLRARGRVRYEQLDAALDRRATSAALCGGRALRGPLSRSDTALARSGALPSARAGISMRTQS